MSEAGPPSPTGGMPGWAPAPTQTATGWGVPPAAASPYGYATPPWGPPGNDPKRRYKRGALVWAALGGAVGALVLMVGLLVIIGLTIDNNTSSSISATHPLANESSQAVRVGECLSASPNEAVVVGRGQVVTCASQHGSEVIGLAQFPDSLEYPDSDDLGGFADKACAVPFHDYVGKTAADSDISGKSIVPNRTAWRAGDRKVWCLVDSSTYGNGRGSVRGANR